MTRIISASFSQLAADAAETSDIMAFDTTKALAMSNLVDMSLAVVPEVVSPKRRAGSASPQKGRNVSASFNLSRIVTGDVTELIDISLRNIEAPPQSRSAFLAFPSPRRSPTSGERHQGPSSRATSSESVKSASSAATITESYRQPAKASDTRASPRKGEDVSRSLNLPAIDVGSATPFEEMSSPSPSKFGSVVVVRSSGSPSRASGSKPPTPPKSPRKYLESPRRKAPKDEEKTAELSFLVAGLSDMSNLVDGSLNDASFLKSSDKSPKKSPDNAATGRLSKAGSPGKVFDDTNCSGKRVGTGSRGQEFFAGLCTSASERKLGGSMTAARTALGSRTEAKAAVTRAAASSMPSKKATASPTGKSRKQEDTGKGRKQEDKTAELSSLIFDANLSDVSNLLDGSLIEPSFIASPKKEAPTPQRARVDSHSSVSRATASSGIAAPKPRRSSTATLGRKGSSESIGSNQSTATVTNRTENRASVQKPVTVRRVSEDAPPQTPSSAISRPRKSISRPPLSGTASMVRRISVGAAMVPDNLQSRSYATKQRAVPTMQPLGSTMHVSPARKQQTPVISTPGRTARRLAAAGSSPGLDTPKAARPLLSSASQQKPSNATPLGTKISARTPTSISRRTIPRPSVARSVAPSPSARLESGQARGYPFGKSKLANGVTAATVATPTSKVADDGAGRKVSSLPRLSIGATSSGVRASKTAAASAAPGRAPTGLRQPTRLSYVSSAGTAPSKRLSYIVS